MNRSKFFWREILSKARWNGTRGKGHRAKIDEGTSKRLRMNLSESQGVHLFFRKLDSAIAVADEMPDVIGANSRCD